MIKALSINSLRQSMVSRRIGRRDFRKADFQIADSWFSDVELEGARRSAEQEKNNRPRSFAVRAKASVAVTLCWAACPLLY